MHGTVMPLGISESKRSRILLFGSLTFSVILQLRVHCINWRKSRWLRAVSTFNRHNHVAHARCRYSWFWVAANYTPDRQWKFPPWDMEIQCARVCHHEIHRKNIHSYWNFGFSDGVGSFIQIPGWYSGRAVHCELFLCVSCACNWWRLPSPYQSISWRIRGQEWNFRPSWKCRPYRPVFLW